ncbi:phasin family protein [Coralloluteibacterium stylophorae]|uniref:Phasin family protein n=1 Tax=Coralloluteibacterium stylophorae TaxID=1776034 RepID=A0A8J7VR64_9GAMM|nr:phasin family protein [Coralloluteibacterium stylophorae]MBS7458453.1 phasin family protein [Coralloluteibacterium stylophorae]
MQSRDDDLRRAARTLAEVVVESSAAAFGGLERLACRQVRMLDARLGDTLAFLDSTPPAGAAEDLQTMWTRGLALARDNLESGLDIGHDAFEEVVRTQQDIGRLVRSGFERAAATAEVV